MQHAEFGLVTTGSQMLSWTLHRSHLVACLVAWSPVSCWRWQCSKSRATLSCERRCQHPSPFV